MVNKVILLVEDNVSDAKMVQRALNRIKLDYELIVLQDGSEALDYLFGTGIYNERDTRVLPQFVLLDLSLPNMSGLQVLEKLRAQESTKHLPVIIFTSSTEKSDILTSYEFGANSYVIKPIELEDFTAIVQQTAIYWYNLNQISPGVS